MDWIGLFLTMLGVILNARRMIICWHVWVLSNIAWIIHAARSGQSALVLVNFGLIVANLYGLWCWQKGRRGTD